jgi:hypothetical protein
MRELIFSGWKTLSFCLQSYFLHTHTHLASVLF